MWQQALPPAPTDEGVVKAKGVAVVQVNRFLAEAAAERGDGDAADLVFAQLARQLHDVDPAVIRRRDRGFKVALPLYLAHISPISRPYLAHISRISRPHLPPGQVRGRGVG